MRKMYGYGTLSIERLRLILTSLPQNFFSVYRNLFNCLASDELHHTEGEFSFFIYATCGWAALSKEHSSEAAQLFSNFWFNFKAKA